MKNATESSLNNNEQHLRIEREQQVIEYMIALFCKARHQKGRAKTSAQAQTELCSHCEELRAYTRQQNERCPFIETRSFCQFCQVHCYKLEMRKRIGEVMRYAGPRMLWHKPVYALRHFVALRQYRKGRKG